MLFLALILAAGCGDHDDAPALPPPVSVRSADDAGLFAWIADDELLDTAQASTGQPAVIQWRAEGGDWAAVEGPAGQSAAADTRYYLPAGGLGGDPASVELRVALSGALSGDDGGEPAAPLQIALYADVDATEPPLNSSDSITPTFSTSLAPIEDAVGAMELEVTLAGADGNTTGWIDGHCPDGSPLRDCVLGTAKPWTVTDLHQAVALPSLLAVHDQPATIAFTVRIFLDAVGADGLPTQVLLAEDRTEPRLSMGRRLFWGDLHAHSNLSHDGCEDWEDDCGVLGDHAAQDFFENARNFDLDFVAITDHAEWGTFYADGLGTVGVDIWEEQKRLATAADSAGLVTLVGYEWTNFRTKPTDLEGYEGGHKTVIFEQLDVHEDFRIGTERDEEVVKKADGSTYLAAANERTTDPVELVELLDAAAELHGPTRLLTFFHHSAIDIPQGVDFRQDFNIPDPRYEPVVEMFSEHGSSECVDVDAPDCDFAVQKETIVRLDYGSIQYALSSGLQLGFVSGTDCHDSRPGSIHDGPGWHGSPEGDESVIVQQFAAGGLTGAWVADPLDRVGLFDAIFERATLSTTGPRVKVHLLAVDDLGRPWLPGAIVPGDATSLTISGRFDGNGYTVQRIQLIDTSGAVTHEVEGELLEHTIQLADGDGWYVRLIMAGDAIEESGQPDTGQAEEREPHRVWLSPFFVEATE